MRTKDQFVADILSALKTRPYSQSEMLTALKVRQKESRAFVQAVSDLMDSGAVASTRGVALYLPPERR